MFFDPRAVVVEEVVGGLGPDARGWEGAVAVAAASRPHCGVAEVAGAGRGRAWTAEGVTGRPWRSEELFAAIAVVGPDERPKSQGQRPISAMGRGTGVGVVLVHGSPETSAVWDPLLRELNRDDITCLSPPGFGAGVPDGWRATVEDYRDWLIAELQAFGSPVDVVGHDWGGAHVVTATMARSDLVRSWCTDVIGIFDPEYVWHELAQLLQTPDAGEQAVAAWAAQPAPERVAGFVALGVSADVAERLADGFDEAMGRCILGLYRSARQPAMARLGEGLAAAARRPGLHLRATNDHLVGGAEMQRRAAARAGARVEVLDSLGHWWMAQDPKRVAATLTQFWASVPN